MRRSPSKQSMVLALVVAMGATVLLVGIVAMVGLTHDLRSAPTASAAARALKAT